MGWYALGSVEEAVDKTKEFLFPIDWKLWTKIAFIALFLGNIGSLPALPTTDTGSLQTGIDTGQDYAQITTDHRSTLENMLSDVEMNSVNVQQLNNSALIQDSVVFLILGLVALVGIVFLYISAVFEFVFYRSLIEGDVNIVSNFQDYVLEGAKYLGIFLAVLAFLGLTGSIGYFAFEYSLLVSVLALLFIVPLWLASFLFLFFTQNMVLPEIVAENKGFRSSYKSVYSYVVSQWKQAGLFIIGKTILDLLTTVLVFVATLFIFIIVLIPLSLISLLFALIHPILLIISLILGILSVLLGYLYLKVPIQTFIYNYVISVYRKFEESSKVSLEN